MEHPLIGNISELTLEELGAKVNELSKKMAIAQRSGNGHLCNQVRMALETFQTQYASKLKQQWSTQPGGDFSDKINIE